MPNCVSLCIKVNNVWGLIRALAFIEAGNSAVVQPLDPFGGALDSVAQGNVEVGYLPIILDITVRGSVKCVLIVLDMVVEPVNLLLEAADFAGLLSFTSSDGCEEPFSDGSEDIGIEVRVCCQCGRNSIEIGRAHV